jgi:hypothetical protein
VEILSRLEADGFAWGYGDLGAGARISADSGLAWLDGEDAEPAQFDPVSFSQRLFHGLEDGVYGCFCLGADKPGAFYDALDEILFDQLGTFPAFLGSVLSS